MTFEDFFRNATSRIRIVGTNSLSPWLEARARFFADLLLLSPDLCLTILCESDSENFSQSLCMDGAAAAERASSSYTALRVHRDRILGRAANDGLLAEIQDELRQSTQQQAVLSRIQIRQLNLRMPVNIIEADGRLWFSITGTSPPTIDSYAEVEPESGLYRDLRQLSGFYVHPDKGGIFLSRPGEELIEMYDKQGIPRGIFPRACFYTTAYERYSIWGFVFNRKGDLLLHQRSKTTDDGRGLWDKSVGGHVDLRDSSTFITAERELVEELFLPEAEYSKYIRADLGDIVHFGDWNPGKRPERSFRTALADLAPADWAIFRATNDEGDPLVVTRVSERRIHLPSGEVTTKRTVFRSDVYLFIAPKGYLDDEEQMDRLVGVAEQRGAAQDHRLLSLESLRQWIEEVEAVGGEKETFTDDLLYINLRHRELLEGFAEFVRYLAEQGR